MPTPIKRTRRAIVDLMLMLTLALAGCGEPSARELKNRQEFEALLSAVSLKNKAELEKDAKRIEARHASGALSAGAYADLEEIIKTARSGDWTGAETRAYAFRERSPYFK